MELPSASTNFVFNDPLFQGVHSAECESALDSLIHELFSLSFAYTALYAYFDRNSVALKGFAKFFMDSSDKERKHAMKLIRFQNVRGGRVKFYSIEASSSEYANVEKGDALEAMESILCAEKLACHKILILLKIAARFEDTQMTGFIEREFLAEKVKAISTIAGYVAQLRMLGKGLGVWCFDQKLLRQG